MENGEGAPNSKRSEINRLQFKLYWSNYWYKDEVYQLRTHFLLLHETLKRKLSEKELRELYTEAFNESYEKALQFIKEEEEYPENPYIDN